MPKWTEANVPDQNGRVVLITGANSGIGWEAARVLAGRGAKVLLACRSAERGNEAVARITALSPRADVRFLSMDLSDLDSTRRAAEQVRKDHARLDLLINNAGLMATPQGRTAQGFEMQFGVNHLGHFALTGLLLPLLLATPASRVVTVSSVGHRPGHIDLAGGFLNQILHTMRSLIERLFLQDAAMGALPTLRAAVDPDARGGEYYGPDGFREQTGHPVRVDSSKRSKDVEAARRLWRASEELTGVTYAFDAR